MRKWRSLEAFADDGWAVNHLIVGPKIYRLDILNSVHGHLDVNKPFHKILNKFIGLFNGRCSKLLQILTYLSGGRET